MYYKRIVCDIDDTIIITKDRDFLNAEPIQDVINKINYLYDLGWEIWLVTARGQLSCNGDSKQADFKYRKQIEDVLSKYGVKYHKLSFEKFLATYYIDDKNLTPECFINLDIRPLGKGWSGAVVELRNGRVYKTHQNSLQASKWYKVACRFFDTPNVYSLIGETLCLEYIESNGTFNIDKVISILERFEKIKIECEPFFTYIQRIKSHCDYDNDFYEIIPYLESIEIEMHQYKSFCHGDFSVDNILVKDKIHYLIDPIYEEKSYSSFLLDVSKFLMSLRKQHLMVEYNFIFDYFSSKISSQIISYLEISQWIRIYKYAPDIDKSKIAAIINELLDAQKD
jgi:capsule biosynthesis phosphatase